MESIQELREICQDTRPSIYRDFLSRLYYKVSIYLTWGCLALGLSANQVTLLSGFIAFLGGLLVGSQSIIWTLIGVFCFHLFAILDMCDGEVARYRNQGGVNGHYLDWYMHFITSTSMIFGLFIASFEKLDHPILLIIGLVAVVTPIMDKSSQNAGWTVICWTRMRDLKKGIEPPTPKPIDNDGNSPKKLPKTIKLIRFFMLSPFQERWISIIMIILPLASFAFEKIGLGIFPYKFLLLLYIGVVGPIYIFLKIKALIKGTGLSDGYQRITKPNREIRFPEDDFLG